MTNDPHYDKNLLQLWEKGALAPVTLPKLSKNLATSLRHKLYRLRIKMQKNQHPSATAALGASINISPHIRNGSLLGYDLTVYPLSLELGTALEEAGIKDPNNLPPLE
jgi:hypothetical protein